MLNNPFSSGPERSMATRSAEGLITWLAAATALFGGLLLHEKTAHLIEQLTLRTYGAEWAWLTDLAWQLVCFPLVFFAARASYYVLFAAMAAVAARYAPIMAF